MPSSITAAAVTFQEYVILPAPHPEQNLANKREVMGDAIG